MPLNRLESQRLVVSDDEVRSQDACVILGTILND